MRNEWRVDRSEGQYAPCGMNSIRYIGENRAKANQMFLALLPGFDAWNHPDPKYGVVLSRWDAVKCEYAPMGWKDCTGSFYLKV